MTKEHQRIVILEFMGWTELSRSGRRVDGPMMALRGTNPSGVKNQIAPNPLTNLNVVHEVELTLWNWDVYPFPATVDLYEMNLHTICNRDSNYIWNAKPEQRCKALLQTLNKWEKS